MGRAKALLACGAGGETFVSRIITTLRAGGVADVLVVTRADDDALREALQGFRAAVRLVINADPARGQLSSLLAGLDVADRPGVRGALVIPVDMPLVRATSVSAVLDTFRMHADAPVVRAVHAGRHGHPVIFAHRVFDELRAADPRVGAKAVVRAHADAIIDVDVDDPGVLRDIDEPADYESAFAAAGPGGALP